MSKFKNLKAEEIDKFTPEEMQELIDHINEEIISKGLKITVRPEFDDDHEPSYVELAEMEDFFSDLAVKFISDKYKFRN